VEQATQKRPRRDHDGRGGDTRSIRQVHPADPPSFDLESRDLAGHDFKALRALNLAQHRPVVTVLVLLGAWPPDGGPSAAI
jgi:hypothetical protein